MAMFINNVFNISCIDYNIFISKTAYGLNPFRIRITIIEDNPNRKNYGKHSLIQVILVCDLSL